ncbi:MAG: chromate transporter [Erysipelotrichaceae bacterium]|nr:chromate transporter [Erysipelotrichaceae bacterium]
MLIEIILSFIKIGSLAFGGAYAAIPLVEKEIVEVRGWMTYAEFSDLLALDELTPGPILINSATFVGMKLHGISGAIAATIGCIIPSCIISLILISIYRKYKKISFMESIMNALKCMAIALIFSTFLRILLGTLSEGILLYRNVNVLALFTIPLAFFALRKYKINPLYVILGCGLLNMLVAMFYR